MTPAQLLAQIESEFLADRLTANHFLDLRNVLMLRPDDYLEERCRLTDDPPDTKRFDRFRRQYGKNPTFADMMAFQKEHQQEQYQSHERGKCRNMKPVSIPSRVPTNN